MGWGDLLGGIGAVAQGANQGYQFERELQAKKELAKQQEELRMMLGQITAGSRERVADINAGARTRAEEIKTQGRLALQDLINSGNTSVQALKNDGMKEVRRLANEGMLDVEDLRAASRLDLKNIDKEIQAAHDTANIARTERTAEATENAAETGAQSRRDVEDTRQAGENRRFDLSQPLKAYNLELRRYPRQGNQRQPRGQAPKPFGPSYDQFLGGKMDSGDFNLDLANQRGGGAAGPTPAPAPAPAAPTFQAPSFQMGRPAQASPLMPNPGAAFGPSSAMPAMPAAPAAPAPAMAAPPAAPDFSLADVGTMPVSALAPGMTGGRALPVEAKPQSTDERLKGQANDLMQRMKAAETAGDYKQWQSLRQQLQDLIK
jgi:hypothetical protein